MTENIRNNIDNECQKKTIKSKKELKLEKLAKALKQNLFRRKIKKNSAKEESELS